MGLKLIYPHGKQIRKLREEYEITIDEIVDKTGLPYETVESIEAGEPCGKMKLKKVMRCLEIFDDELDEYMLNPEYVKLRALRTVLPRMCEAIKEENKEAS
jgi:predicted transcriptional regulator